MADDEYLGIVTLVGEEGSGKTTMALTFPKPLSHLDIDVGGFRRAAWHADISQVESHSFPKPLTEADIAKMKGLDVANPQASTRAIGVPKKIEGMIELWQKIIDQIVKDCLTPAIKTIVVDSATMQYKIGCDAYLQELQMKQEVRWRKEHPNTAFDQNDYREKLQPVEYGFVYDRLQRIYHTTRAYRKNLILTHYPTDEYGPMPDGRGGMADGKTGKIIIDGYKDTAKFSDLVMWLSIKERLVSANFLDKNAPKTKENYISAKFTKCSIEGVGLKAVGQEIVGSYQSIVDFKNMITGG